MAQQRRQPKKKLTMEDVLGPPEEQEAERREVARLLRRYRRYTGTLEATREALNRALGEDSLSDMILEARRESP